MTCSYVVVHGAEISNSVRCGTEIVTRKICLKGVVSFPVTDIWTEKLFYLLMGHVSTVSSHLRLISP